MARSPPPAPPRPAPHRTAPHGASTDVSLGGGAARQSGCSLLTWSGAKPKRDPEPEQPPPWRVSPAGAALALPGRIRAPLRSPARSGAHQPGPPRPPGGRPAPPALPGPACAAASPARGVPGWRGRSPCVLTPLLLFLSSSQISGSHQALLCHPAGNSEAREEGEFPRSPSEEAWRNWVLKFTVQLKMASTRRVETLPLFPWGVEWSCLERCPGCVQSPRTIVLYWEHLWWLLLNEQSLGFALSRK